MAVSKGKHRHKGVFLEENLKGRGIKFMNYEITGSINENRGIIDTYFMTYENNSYILTLYKKGLYAPQEILLKYKSIEEEKRLHLVQVEELGYNEEEQREYIISSIKRNTTIKNRKIKNYKRLINQVISAIKVSHENELYHFDLRPEDIFIDEKHPNTYKVYGFGHIPIGKEELDQEKIKIKGLMSKYQAPELEKGIISGKSDFWSFGVILYEKIYRKLPFEYEKNEFGKYKISFSTINIEKKGVYASLFKGLLNIEPEERWGHEEVEEWLLYLGNKDDGSIKKSSSFSSKKKYNNLLDLHLSLGFSPEGYLKLERLYYSADVSNWLLDKKEYEKIKKLDMYLSNKYYFNAFLYNYGKDSQRLYYKGYNLRNIKNLDKFSIVDLKKLSKLMSGASTSKQSFFYRLHSPFNVSKYSFYYAYIDNNEFYLDNKKASDYNFFPDYSLEDDNPSNFLIFRQEKSYKNFTVYLSFLLERSNGNLSSIREALLSGEFQLELFKDSLIDEAVFYVDFIKNKSLKAKNIDFAIFKKVFYDYSFLNLPFEKVIKKVEDVRFYDFYVREKYGVAYYNYYKKISKLFLKESLFNFFIFETKSELDEVYPSLANIKIIEKEYIKFQMELLEKIYVDKLYENKNINCKLKSLFFRMKTKKD